MQTVMQGVRKSRTIRWNLVIMLIGGLELMGSHITTTLGPKWSAALVMVGAFANIVLRYQTTQAISEKE
jgi:hypothetical protein